MTQQPTHNIKTRRAQLGVTQEQAAQELGLSVRGYWNKENGETEFRQSEMLKLANLLQISADELFSSTPL